MDKRKQITNEKKANNTSVTIESIDDKIIDDSVGDDSETERNNNEIDEKPTLEQAYSTLSDIAIFLEQEQPQSPASTLLKITNVIGKKTFQELMEINMQNGSTVMSTISELYKILK